MKAFLISDNHDTLVLMRLAGIPGVIAHGSDETAEAVDKALKDRNLAILVITELAAESIPERIQNLRQRESLPLLVEIPDRHGTRRDSDFLSHYVREAIGVKME
ncbi:MAG: V-type ATP synthase subunit F [Synergistaceae bacterium]|nr:V-type ATP synthase subunit F [Synergistaceae bacterium]